MKEDRVYIAQMLDSVRKIESFTKDISENDFLHDEKTQSAVILQLIILGELTKKLSLEAKDLSVLPWKDIAGFRDRAIHHYFGMDLEIVWITVKEDILVLKDALQKIQSNIQ